MLFKKQIRRRIGQKTFDVAVVVSLIAVFITWLKVYIVASQSVHGWGGVVPLSDYIRDALIFTCLFALSAYYAIDQNASKKRGFMDEEERLKNSIDQRIIDAHTSLSEIREGVKAHVINSDKFDHYAKQLILSKTKVIYESCVKRLKKAQQLRTDIDRIPTRLVRAKLEVLHEFLIKNVTMGINQIGEILARIHELNLGKNLGTKDIEQLGSELDEELRVAEMVDKTMVEWEYGKENE